MYADEQDRISTGDSHSTGVGRPMIVDVIVISVLVLIATIAAYFYFSEIEPDYDSLKYSDDRTDDSSSNQPSLNESQALTIGGTGVEKLLQPAAFDDEEMHEKLDLPEETPELNNSDNDLLAQLTGLTSLNGVVAWSDAADLARRFVVLVYNLAEGEVAYKSLPLKNPNAAFSTLGRGDSLRISSRSYSRYDSYANAFASMDAERAVAIYRFFWPTLNAAFAELGEPKKSLHNEAIKALDHLLATPDVGDDLKLVRPAVYYRYADPALEQLSAAQKQMLRLGAKNRALIKAKLQEIKGLMLDGQR